MENISNLENFAKILTEKGYNGYFLTASKYPDKIKESIEAYLKCCQDGTDNQPRGDHMLLSTYLKWDGEDKPHVQCTMYVKNLGNKFFLDKMEINLAAPGNLSIKKVVLNNLTVATAPNRLEAVDMVWRVLQFKSEKNMKRARLKF
ncbi:hypothetical protein SF1_18560 [Sphingobacterium faecium NBRC 15299]|uniref:hypothetical protein n=1 Tax=Sphingobacterium faecium TaxID=34087 RepID=UPI000D395C84|nr:hypothetical protein [Sphingobacterium faecium]PTX09505.1 hypothetical protein C8N37_106133 [Sphingobacterium faecium]GEM63874.1 hypothetical protein SF1_18560 [Sphingobacterium faecium NBRC 15299]